MQQQAEIALPPTSSAEPDGRSAIKKLAQLDAAWLASQLDAAWLTVLLCYCAVFGGILIYSDFLPYTFDNNESFSAFWHARNMYEYGIANSSGLADESFSYDAAAHPYVYTHAGASPRLFAYLLYVLGIRTIEVQIAVTVFTVGLLAFWFAYRFLAEISTRLYATIACLLLMTDYIMFTQWHVGAWHVWKMLLLFGGLYLAQRIAARKQAYSLLVVYAFHAFLFYYETIFNVYVAAAVFLYFVFASRDYRFVVKFGLAQFAGALTAAAVLLGQLVLQFGWDVVRTDIYYTFIGRNFATDSAAFLEAARAFYAEHNIVFWLNVPDIDPYRNLLWAFRSLFQDHAVHTPPWSLIVLAFAAAEIIRRLRSRRGTLFNLSARMSARPNRAFANVDWKLVVKDTTVLALPILAILSALTFCILSTYPEIGAGLAPPPSFWIFVVWSLVIAAAIVAIAVLSRARPGLGALPIVPELARPRDLFDRIDWELVSKDATVLAKFLLAALTIAILYVLADLAPPWLFWTLAAAVIGIGILAAAALDRRSLQARALPRVRMFFNAIDWKMVIKDATVLAPFMLLALVMPPLIGVGIVAAAIVFRHPLQERALPRLSKFFARVVWNWPVKDEWKRPLPLYFRSFTIPRLTPLSQRTLFADPGRIFGASAFIAAVLAFLLVQPSLYAGTAAVTAILQVALASVAGYTTGLALVVLTMLLLAAWYASGSITPCQERAPDRLVFVLAALLLAYMLLYFVFTGYVLTGYFARYLSLTVYFDDLLLALGLVAMIGCVRGWYAAFRQSTHWQRIAYGSGATVATVGLAAVVVYWSTLQTFLFRKLPPDQISFFSILSKPPFRGSTFAASMYGGTVAYFTKNWAYLDGYARLAEGNVTLGSDGYDVKRDSPYLWFADRAVNPAYNKPEYFLAVTSQFQGLGPAYLTDDKSAPRLRVGDTPLIRAIREERTSYLHPVEVARDPSPLDRWSIVRLDWDFPPFLRALESGEFVTLDASSTGDGIRVSVDYRYAHQEGVPEADTRITLSAQSRCAGSKEDASVPLAPLVAGTREFRLPRSFRGTVRAEVQPATATKVGPTYISRPLQLPSPDACKESSAVPK